MFSGGVMVWYPPFQPRTGPPACLRCGPRSASLTTPAEPDSRLWLQGGNARARRSLSLALFFALLPDARGADSSPPVPFPSSGPVLSSGHAQGHRTKQARLEGNFASQQTLFGNSEPRCQQPLTWIYFSSPAWTWSKLCRRAGWLGICDPCHIQVEFDLVVMN